MKRKILTTFSEYQKFFCPEEGIKFFIESPFDKMRLPNNSFMTLEVPKFFAIGVQSGTLCITRLVHDGLTKFDVDVYRNYVNPGVTLIERIGPDKKIDYHHREETLPDFMAKGLSSDQTDAGVKIREMIENHLKGQSQ